MKESGYYPPGAEFHPDAPYNQKEVPDLEQIEAVLSHIGELEEMMECEDILNGCLKDVRDLYDRVNKIKLDVEDGEY